MVLNAEAGEFCKVLLCGSVKRLYQSLTCFSSKSEMSGYLKQFNGILS